MVEITITDESVVFEVKGWDKLWSLRSRIEVPLAHIRDVRADPEIARGWWHGFKVAGTEFPGVIAAGMFYRQGHRTFWDVHDPENTIVVVLTDETFSELIVEVADPAEAVALLRKALAGED